MQIKSFNFVNILILSTVLGLFSPFFAKDFFKVKESIEESSWRKIGFIYIKPSLMIRDVGYSSNIYSYEKSKNPDWTADLGASFIFSSILGNRFIIRVTDTPYYSFYLHNKKQENFNNRLKADLITYFGNINIHYSYSGGRFKTRPTSEFGAKTVIRNLSHNISLDLGRQNSLFFTIYLKNNRILFEDINYLDDYDLSGTMDRIANTIGGAVNIPIFTRTHISFHFDYFDNNFLNNSLRNGFGRKAYTQIEFPEIGIIKGRFSIGMKYFNPSEKDAEEYLKPVGSGNVSIRLFRKLNLLLGYTIDNHYSFSQSDAYFDTRSFSIGTNFYLTRFLRIGYRFSNINNKYRLISDESLVRSDSWVSSDATVVFRIKRNLGFGIKYTNFSGRSTNLDFVRNYSFIGGYITHEF